MFLCCAVAVTLAGVAVRWHFLDYPMRYDEAFNYFHYASRTPWYIATHCEELNNHVLHSLLVRFSIHFFGTTPPALRLPAFVAGVLLIPLTGWLAWSVFRRRPVTLLSMLAACGSSHLVEYSVNSRGYTWLAVFATLAAICTIRLMNAPATRRLWIVWGLLGALGAYTVPIMAFPMLSLGAALLVRVLRAPRGGAERRRLVRGLTLGSLVCAVGTFVLYLPILATHGVSGMVDKADFSYEVYRAWLDAQGGRFPACWRSLTRHSNLVWQVVLIVGLMGFLISAIHRPSSRYLVPLIMLLVIPAVVWVCGVPMVPRCWTFALPLFLACSMYGVFTLPGVLIRARAATAVTTVVVAITALSATMSLATVCRQRYLSTWEHELVDIERILDECQSFGTQRCALVIRYTPASAYYLRQRGMTHPLSPADPHTGRVYITVGTLRSLGELWHGAVPGFAQYHPPRVWRKFSRSTLYVTDRIATMDDQHGL